MIGVPDTHPADIHPADTRPRARELSFRPGARS